MTEHMDYLIENGYTDDAERLASHQFDTGLRMAAWYTGDGAHLPRATRAGLEVARLEAEYADERETTSTLLAY